MGTAHVVLSPSVTLLKDRWTWIEPLLPSVLERLEAIDLHIVSPTEIRVYDSRQNFRTATGQRQRWLRAWSTRHQVHLLAPPLWRRDDADRRWQCLVHELTHVAMFQHYPSDDELRGAELPFWFREGVASFAALQGPQRLSFEELLPLGSTNNLLRDAATLRLHHAAAYAVAHHAVAWLAEREGTKVITRLLTSSRSRRFTEALEQVCGLTEAVMWHEMVQARTKTGVSTRPSKGMSSAWQMAL